MANINIHYATVTREVNLLAGKIQNGIIDASGKSRELIISMAENSSGDFMEALKEEVNNEMIVIKETGELLTAMAQYIQSAADSFAKVDRSFNVSKV